MYEGWNNNSYSAYGSKPDVGFTKGEGGKTNNPSGGWMENPDAPRGGALSPYSGEYPKEWVDTYNGASQEVQQAMRDRFWGMSPADIAKDWNMNIQPQYGKGVTPEQILGGASPGINPGEAGVGTPGGSNMFGGRTSLGAQLHGPGNYYNQLVATQGPGSQVYNQRKADQDAYGPGSGTEYDPWLAHAFQLPGPPVKGPRGTVYHDPKGTSMFYHPGYGPGLNGQVIQWAGGKAPTNTGFESISPFGGMAGPGGQPMPDWLQQANTRFRLSVPRTGGTKQDWDRYRQELEYYAPDIQAWYKTAYPGQKDPLTDFLGTRSQTDSPIY